MTLIIHILIRFIEYCCDSGILLLNSWTYEKKFQIFHPYVTRGCIAWPPEWNEELEEDEKINPSFYTSAYTRDLTDSKGLCVIYSLTFLLKLTVSNLWRYCSWKLCLLKYINQISMFMILKSDSFQLLLLYKVTPSKHIEMIKFKHFQT